MFNQDYEVQIL